MPLYILRKGDGWTLNHGRPESRMDSENRNDLTDQDTQRQVTDRFKQIAQQYGSRAVWLPQTGLLVTECASEQNGSFPYEEWREQAIRDTNAAGN